MSTCEETAPMFLRGVDRVTTGSYFMRMRTVSIKEAKSRLTALAREVESGETIVATRNGKPVFDLVPHRKKGGLDLKALREFKREHGLSTIVASVSEDFDEPLPEDFLIRPLP
jgi:prevent-host-death family protein